MTDSHKSENLNQTKFWFQLLAVVVFVAFSRFPMVEYSEQAENGLCHCLAEIFCLFQLLDDVKHTQLYARVGETEREREKERE